MKPTTVNVELARVEGALLRFVGLVGRRGFEITALCADSSLCGTFLSVTADLLGSRCPHVLARQIARLHEVRSVRIAEPNCADPGLSVPKDESKAGKLCGAA